MKNLLLFILAIGLIQLKIRLEFREDQRKHIVLTSAVELNEDDFYARLSDSVTAAPEQDLLLFYLQQCKQSHLDEETQ